jgi:hypothetical protein
MALTTKREIVQEIAYEIYAGMPSNDRSISDNYILRQVNNEIAAMAVKSAFGSYNLDGAVCADDIFRLTYTGISVTLDTTSGYYSFPLPAQPVGIPGERSFEIYPPANRGGAQSTMFKMIARSEVQFIRSMPGIKKVFCFVDGGNMCLVDSYQITPTYSTLNMSVITSGANDLNAFMNLPDDMIKEVQDNVVAQCRKMLMLQDTNPMPAQDSPQPR